jgi:uncharacterized protein (TIGR03437 family)
LTNSVVFVRVPVAGTAAPQTLEAFNIGDGSLSPTSSVPSSVPWLTVSVAEPGACVTIVRPGLCVPLQFDLNTASLSRGTYTASVTVSDPDAIDAPQVVTVTVQVGSGEPTAIDQYVAPGTTRDVFILPGGSCAGIINCPHVETTTQDGGPWLSLSVVFNGMGTFYYYSSFSVILGPPPDMLPGTYTGTVYVSAPIDGYAIPVTMRVTTQPIAVPSTTRISVRLAEEGPPATYPFLPFISLRNDGMGTLEVQDVTASGAGVSAEEYAGGAIVTADPRQLAPGAYTDGLVTIQCNAANCPLQVPVNLEIVPRGPPLLYYQGVVDNATFVPGATVAQGDVVVVKGEQLSLSAPAFAAGAPLPTKLGGAQVVVNDLLANLFYSSFGQIAFQMPSHTTSGIALVRIERDGQAGNTVTVNVAQRAPRIVVVTDSSYHGRDTSHPAKPGETLIIWAIGLGPTEPAVADGASAPANPPAVVTVTPTVKFNDSLDVAPCFAGLSPGSVGLYQVMVTLPAVKPSAHVNVQLRLAELYSNVTEIAVQ